MRSAASTGRPGTGRRAGPQADRERPGHRYRATGFAPAGDRVLRLLRLPALVDRCWALGCGFVPPGGRRADGAAHRRANSARDRRTQIRRARRGRPAFAQQRRGDRLRHRGEGRRHRPHRGLPVRRTLMADPIRRRRYPQLAAGTARPDRTDAGRTHRLERPAGTRAPQARGGEGEPPYDPNAVLRDEYVQRLRRHYESRL